MDGLCSKISKHSEVPEIHFIEMFDDVVERILPCVHFHCTETLSFLKLEPRTGHAEELIPPPLTACSCADSLISFNLGTVLFGPMVGAWQVFM